MNVTISLDEKTLEAGRRYAKERGMSLNALIRELLNRTARGTVGGTLEDAFRAGEELDIRVDKIDWRREDLYDV